MKSEQVIAKDAVQQFFLPWETSEHFASGPRNVPELGHHEVRIAVLDHAREQSEVEVLNENNGRAVSGFFDDSIGEDAVNLAVLLPVFRYESRASVSHVAKRP